MFLFSLLVDKKITSLAKYCYFTNQLFLQIMIIGSFVSGLFMLIIYFGIEWSNEMTWNVAFHTKERYTKHYLAHSLFTHKNIFPLHFLIYFSQLFTFLRASSFYDVADIMTSRHPHK